MKKNCLRILTAMLAATCLFSACGNGADTQSSSSSLPESSNTSTDTSGGQETAEPVTIRIMDKHRLETYYNYNDREDFPAFDLYEKELEKRGIILEKELVANEQYGTVVQTRMAAASDLPDLINLTPLDDVTALNLGINGQILDWLKPMEKYSRPDPLAPENINGDPSLSLKQRLEKITPFAISLCTAPDGNMYWMPNARYRAPVKLADGTMVEDLDVVGACIRYDWLQKVNMEVPTTVEEFLEALRAFQKNDVNGNGQKDEMYSIDCYSYSFFSGIAQWFGLTPGVVGIDPNNDRVTSAWYQDGVKDYFKLLKQMVDEGLMDVGLVGATEEMFNQAIAENRIAGLRTYANLTWFADLIKDDPDAEYATIAPIQAVEGVAPFMLCDSNKLVYDKYAMTKACTEEVQEAIIHYYDFATGTDVAKLLSNNGVEGVDYEFVDDERNPGRKVVKSLLTGTTQENYEAHVGGISFFLHGVPWMSGEDPDVLAKLNTGTVQDTLDGWEGSEKGKRGFIRKIEQMVHRPYVISPFSSSTYAIPTQEEQEVLTTYLTALNSYSDELGMNLILGNESLDNWDSFMQKFRDLGLDEVIKVNDARYQRYKNN
mgnify:FL=1